MTLVSSMPLTEDPNPQRGGSGQESEADRRRMLDDDRRRMLQNVAAFVFIVLLLGLGAWIIDRLSAYNRNLLCIQSHRRDCG
jgi:hypothetical protein